MRGRGFGSLMVRALAAISSNAMLTGVASSKALRDDFNRPLPRVEKRRDVQEVRYRQPGRKTTLFMPHGKRERDRRIRQGAHTLQLWSHKLGTVQPRHIFGDGV